MSLTHYKGHWSEMESAREIIAYTAADWHMMIIPSFQTIFHKEWKEDCGLYHVIIDREGENGVLVNCLMTWEDIYNAYKIEL